MVCSLNCLSSPPGKWTFCAFPLYNIIRKKQNGSFLFSSRLRLYSSKLHSYFVYIRFKKCFQTPQFFFIFPFYSRIITNAYHLFMFFIIELICSISSPPFFVLFYEKGTVSRQNGSFFVSTFAAVCVHKLFIQHLTTLHMVSIFSSLFFGRIRITKNR